MTDSLSARAFASAQRMYEADSRLARPRLEDFAHLDLAAPTPQPAAAATAPTADDAAVRAAVERMQAATGVTFAPPPDAA